MKDLYAVLNVNRDADDEAIRKAYRRLVARYHPDRNPSEDAAEKFREVKQAYDVLGDAERRLLYDLHGELALNPNFKGFGPESDAERRGRFGDFFSQFRDGYGADVDFGAADVNHDAGFPEFKFGEHPQAGQREHRSRGRESRGHKSGQTSSSNSNRDFNFGSSRARPADSNSTSESRSRPYAGTSPAQDRYERFDPSKVRSSFRATMENSFSSTAHFAEGDAQNQGGAGTSVSAEEAARLGIPRRGDDIEVTVHITLREALEGCRKNITVSRPSRWKKTASDPHSAQQMVTEQVALTLSPGVASHSSFRIQGKGGRGVNGAASGDLVVLVEVQPHPYFHREGLNLFSIVPLTWMELLEGCTLEVPTLTSVVRLNIPAGMRPGQKLRVKGKGLAVGGLQGDLYLIMAPTLPDCSDRSADERERINRLAAELSDLYPASGLRSDWRL